MKQSVNLPKTGQAMKKHRSVMAENAEKEEMNCDEYRFENFFCRFE